MPIIANNVSEVPEDHKIIWRFINLPKFLDLIQRKKLFFSKVALFEDPCEGMNNARAFDKEYWRKFRTTINSKDNVITDEMLENDVAMAKVEMDIWKNRTAANCWHLSEHEPEAFWKLYSDSEFGIAIKTDIRSLKESLNAEKRNLYLGKVKYIDYENQNSPKDTLAPMFYKRKSFQMEQEVRLLLWCDENNNIISEIENAGEYINVDLNTFFKSIYIGPKSPEWFVELVSNLVGNAGLFVNVEKSSIYQLPAYLEGKQNYKLGAPVVIK